MAINWTAMTSLVTNGLDLIVTMMEKVPDIIMPLVGVIIVLLIPTFAGKLTDKVAGIFDKIKF